MQKSLLLAAITISWLSHQHPVHSATCQHSPVIKSTRLTKMAPTLPGLSYAQSLTTLVATVMNYQPTRDLMNQVLQAGAVNIGWIHLGHQGPRAVWDQIDRQILLNADQPLPLGCRISSIVFELHNARETVYFKELSRQAWDKKISRESYVNAIEKKEYENAVATDRLLEQGIKSGYYPASAALPMKVSLASYLRDQRFAGHSQWIANDYDRLMVERNRMAINERFSPNF